MKSNPDNLGVVRRRFETPNCSGLDRSAGIGLRTPHCERFLDPNTAPPSAWLEVHAENYFDRGGIRHKMLCAIAERYPIRCSLLESQIGQGKLNDEFRADQCRVVFSLGTFLGRANALGVLFPNLRHCLLLLSPHTLT